MRLDSSIAPFCVVRGAVPAEQWQRWLEVANGLSFEPATVGYPTGAALRPDVRSNLRATWVSEGEAARLLGSVGHLVPKQVLGRAFVGFSPRFRVYRYVPGHRFNAHRDGIEKGTGMLAHATSLLTVLISLQQAERGGETRFHRANESVVLAPGDLLWFQHPLLHEGALVEAGEKWVLRTDAMFAAEGLAKPSV